MNRMDLSFSTEGEHFGCRAAAVIIRGDRVLAVRNDQLSLCYLPGGTMQLGEDSRAAVTRELREELGLVLTPGELAYVEERFFEAEGQRHQQITFYYRVELGPGQEIPDGSPTDAAGELLHWLPLAQLGQANLVPGFLRERLLTAGEGVEHVVTRE